MYVSSETSFRSFKFDGYTYHYITSRSLEGIEKPEYSGGIAVTDLERTLVDSVKDMDKIAGMEEVVQDIKSMHRMQEKRLLKYMELYQNQFLYQKMGFLLSGNRKQLGLSEKFFEVCKKHIGKSKRYLTCDMESGRYNDDWKLVIPEQLNSIKNGVMEDASI